uniref:G-type lectin S-receptor-like serine/threonine-protein kinase At4g03230 n=1 Tax=Fragaria vesca subsp. vesca TaxID=101020 RepID=UPI0005CAAC73|nr:PREDICTED: G-type lectin S-receptor-like serine/threonine-protein kinase At4g03230 [Fragaria vesca subsp. vesca]
MVSSVFFLYAVLLFFCNDYLLCSARDTLTHADPVIDDGSSATLVSAGGTFELGFFTPRPTGKNNSGADGRFVGIWYHRLTPMTVVWIANREHPLPANTTGRLTIEEGSLRLLGSFGEKYWSTDFVSSSVNMIVKLMETGNLVLMDSDQMAANTLWQSFQNPTDTFIPGMLMDKSFKLTSWRNESDPGLGNFIFKYEKQYIILKKSVPYWKSGEPGNEFSSNEMSPEVAYLLSNFSSTDTSRQSTYHNFTIVRHWNFSYTRLVMNSTGKLQFLTWNENKKYWLVSWSEPKDQCSVFKPCGNFGSCNINNWPLVCKCLPGFRPQSPEDWSSRDFSGGCYRESTLSNNHSTFLSLKMMKVREADLQSNVGNEPECSKVCLENTQCQAYSYAVLPENSGQRGTTTTTSNSSCWTWFEDLNNLVEEYNGGHNVSVRVASSDIESTVRDCKPCGTTMIPYPLSTGPDCGDPMYFHFNCNTLTGQVSFMEPNDAFRVISITPSTQKFVLQGLPAKKLDSCDSRSRAKTLPLNPSSRFKISSWCNADLGNISSEVLSSGVLDVVELSWDLPLEPACNTSEDCKGWPNSTCNIIPEKDATKRCRCNKSFQWNAYNFSCTQEGSLQLEPSNHPSQSSSGEDSDRKVPFYLIIVVVLIGMILLACIISIYIWRRKLTSKQDQVCRAQFDSERRVKELIDTSEFNKEDEKGIDVPFFDFQSILEATDNFSEANKLGQGGYGPVYKGKFHGGQEIAVKRLSKVSGQGLQEFRNEVVLIAKLQHRNLVRLRGYCIKGEEKILLYEYMPNKSLDSFIFDYTQRVFLNWEMRYNIILGIARGLLYLHQDSRLRIVHRDLKTSNVLLDEEMNPKISDFGLARIVGGKETEANTNTVVGTYGYMSPEYALDGTFSIKSDVFSFGVVLLEIISGRKNAGFYQSNQTFSLICYAWELWTEDKVLDLMDKNLQESCNRSEFIKCVNVGLLCVQEDPVDRPTMSNVITLLDSETAVPATPKQPAFFVRRGSSSTASTSTKPETISEITTLEGR